MDQRDVGIRGPRALDNWSWKILAKIFFWRRNLVLQAAGKTGVPQIDDTTEQQRGAEQYAHIAPNWQPNPFLSRHRNRYINMHTTREYNNDSCLIRRVAYDIRRNTGLRVKAILGLSVGTRGRWSMWGKAQRPNIYTVRKREKKSAAKPHNTKSLHLKLYYTTVYIQHR